MKFNSQICTSREQSGRLLALGLKKETADMYHTRFVKIDDWETRMGVPKGYNEIPNEYLLPAWSLHRLIEMALQDILLCGISFVYAEGVYEKIIRIIEYSIKDGRFRKEYLEE